MAPKPTDSPLHAAVAWAHQFPSIWRQRDLMIDLRSLAREVGEAKDEYFFKYELVVAGLGIISAHIGWERRKIIQAIRTLVAVMSPFGPIPIRSLVYIETGLDDELVLPDLLAAERASIIGRLREAEAPYSEVGIVWWDEFTVGTDCPLMKVEQALLVAVGDDKAQRIGFTDYSVGTTTHHRRIDDSRSNDPIDPAGVAPQVSSRYCRRGVEIRLLLSDLREDLQHAGRFAGQASRQLSSEVAARYEVALGDIVGDPIPDGALGEWLGDHIQHPLFREFVRSRDQYPLVQIARLLDADIIRLKAVESVGDQ